MGSPSLICAIIICLIFCLHSITAQQPYASTNCAKFDNTSSVLGYNCNGVNKTCQSYLIFRTILPYNTIASIASLVSVEASQISAINQNITENFTMATNTKVIIPVKCSCSGKFYQANTTYLVKTSDKHYRVISNDTFGGLTTCNAIKRQKANENINLSPNERLAVPLRCACPTRNQVSEKIRYLMSFVVQPGNSISSISDKFGADLVQTFEANEKSEKDSIIQPFTTLLLPLQSPPDSSVMENPPLIMSPLPPPPMPTPTPSTGRDNKWAYFTFVPVAGLILFFVILRCHKKTNNLIVLSESFEAQAQEMVHAKNLDTESLEFLKQIPGITSLKVYSFKDLQAATECFSSGHWIKGLVYKGVLDGNQVAIKKINSDVSKEISVLNKVNHFNLLRLLGVGFNEGVWYLIYEYAVNGPLSDWIYESNCNEKSLNWGKRVQVALDVATGLNYLNSYTSPPLIHKDIKISNILLDADFRAKIAKFALARPVRGHDSQFTLTNHIVGTRVYLAPEFLESGLISPMLDVYSFGVLLLEMLTGKNFTILYEGVKVHLSEVLAPLLSKGEGEKTALREFVDASLGEEYPADMAMSMAVLVDRCLRKDPGSRPSMDEIVRILSKTLNASFI